MIGGLQALVAPLIAAVEARFTLAATLLIRRAVLLIAATLFGAGALLFLSIGVFFGLMPGLGPAGAALIMALIWGLLAAVCFILSRQRPRTVVPPALPPIAPPPPPVASVPPAVPVGAVPPGGLRARINRAAPLLAIGALIAGIIAGRR